MNKTISDRIVEAHLIGREAVFHTNDDLGTGTKYEFTPDGLLDYITDEGGFTSSNDIVTQAELTSAGGAITIPIGSTLDAAIQLIIDAIDPEV